MLLQVILRSVLWLMPPSFNFTEMSDYHSDYSSIPVDLSYSQACIFRSTLPFNFEWQKEAEQRTTFPAHS